MPQCHSLLCIADPASADILQAATSCCPPRLPPTALPIVHGRFGRAIFEAALAAKHQDSLLAVMSPLSLRNEYSNESSVVVDKSYACSRDKHHHGSRPKKPRWAKSAYSPTKYSTGSASTTTPGRAGLCCIPVNVAELQLPRLLPSSPSARSVRRPAVCIVRHGRLMQRRMMWLLRKLLLLSA